MKTRRYKKTRRSYPKTKRNKRQHHYRKKTTKNIRRVRRNRTRKLNAGGLLDNLTRRFARRRENRQPIPLGEDSFESIDPITDAHTLAREKYQSTLDKEYVKGEYGQSLRDHGSKMEQGRKEAESAVVEGYGKDVWKQVQHNFPGKPKPIPEETIEQLTKLFPRDFWESNLEKMKFATPLERRLFMKTLFANENELEVRGTFLKPDVFTSSIRARVEQQLQSPGVLLPFEKKRYNEEIIQKTVNRVVKKIEQFINFYQITLRKNLTRFAVNYWGNPSLGDKNYNRTKNHIIERFGERYWQMISGDFKREITSSLMTTEQ